MKALLDGTLMFPSEYLAAVEFGGKDVTLTISNVELAELRMKDNSTQKKPILHFNGTAKKMVLNKTNSNQIAELHGAEARNWVGKRITLYPTTCQSFGKISDCIRVRNRVPAVGKAPVNASGTSAKPQMASEDAANSGVTAGETALRFKNLYQSAATLDELDIAADDARRDETLTKSEREELSRLYADCAKEL